MALEVVTAFTLAGSGQEMIFVTQQIEAIQQATATTAYVVSGGQSYEVSGTFVATWHHVRDRLA